MATRVRLTDAFVSKRFNPISDGPVQETFWDAVVPGFGLRINRRTGAKSYEIMARQPRRDSQTGEVKASLSRMSIGKPAAIGLADARERAREMLKQLKAGVSPPRIKALHAAAVVAKQKGTVEGTVSDYLERHAIELRSYAAVKRILGNHVLERWRHLLVDEISKRHVIDLVDDLKTDAGPSAAAKSLSIVRTFFRWCLAREIVAVDPTAGLKPPLLQARERVLANGELVPVWRAAERLGGSFGAIVQLLILTGQRRNEVAGMTWEELTPKDGKWTWTIPGARSKNGREHSLILPNLAVDIIEARQPALAQRRGSVFGSKAETPFSGFSKATGKLNRVALQIAREAAAKAGRDGDKVDPLPAWTLHDLRRTAASGMAACGVALAVTEKVLNHVSGSFDGIVGVYQRHDYAVEKAQALELWAMRVRTLVAEAEDRKVVRLRKPA